jgi:hypothetical protein
MAKQLGPKLARVILCSLLLAAAPMSTAPAETLAAPPDLGQLPPAILNPSPQPVAAQVPPRRRPPASSQTEESKGAGSPWGLREAAMAEVLKDIGDIEDTWWERLYPLRGCWKAEFGASGICRSFTFIMCFNSRGVGVTRIRIPGVSDLILDLFQQHRARAAYENGQLIINAGMYDFSKGIVIKCALKGEGKAECAYKITGAGYCGLGWHPVILQRF